MSTLDLAVGRVVHAARLLERAYHDPYGWTAEVDGGPAYVLRRVTPTGVTFEVSGSHRGGVGTVSLLHHGDYIASREAEFPVGDFELEWALTVPTSTLVA